MSEIKEYGDADQNFYSGLYKPFFKVYDKMNKLQKSIFIGGNFGAAAGLSFYHFEESLPEPYKTAVEAAKGLLAVYLWVNGMLSLDIEKDKFFKKKEKYQLNIKQ